MKISINIDDKVSDIQVSITCNRLTPEIEKVVSMIRMLDMQLTGQKDGETFFIDVSKVLYIDTVDKKTFLYTDEDVYETKFRLYELEEQLLNAGFFRVNKSCIINFNHIVSLKTDLERRIRITMRNGEQLMASRQYADVIKQRLGVK